MDFASHHVTELPVGHSTADVAIDAPANVFYTANYLENDNTVSAIDLATCTVVANCQVGQSPIFLALDLASHTAYVTCSLVGSVSVIHPKH